MALPTIWTSHLPPNERKDFLEYIKNSGPIFDRVQAILDSKRQARSKVKLPDYDCPSWALKRAHMDGYLECLSELTELFNIKER